MKLLLDECVDQRLANEIKNHLVTTVPQMGWAGKENSDLLLLAEQFFDVFITTDQNLSFQQDLSKFNIAVLLLYAPTNRLADLKPLIPKIISSLPKLKTGNILKIE